MSDFSSKHERTHSMKIKIKLMNANIISFS